MEASIPQIQKQQFRNETRGWIGAVSIGPKGDEKGIAIEPGGTVWLSEAEQMLTANAPRRAEDNPFIAQDYSWVHPETGELETGQVTPLVPISEARFVPASERPIAGTLADSGAGQAAAAQAAATGDEPEVPVVEERNAATREAEVLAEAPQPPSRAAQAAAAAPEQVEQPTDITPPPAAPAGPPAPPPPHSPGSTEPPPSSVDEANAAKSPGPAAEETGAALPPTGDAPQGAFAAGEEVGTPEAPAQPPAPLPPPEG